MPLAPADFAHSLLEEARNTHPWLHYPLFELIYADRAVRILSTLAVTDEAQARGRLAMRRAITARRICADGMLEAFVGRA